MEKNTEKTNNAKSTRDKKDIKEIRMDLGLSQGEFAKRFNIPRRTIENWEQGKSVPKDYIISLIERVIELEEKSDVR